MPGSLALLALLAGGASAFSPAELWEAWPAARFVRAPAPCLRPTELASLLRALQERHRGSLELEEAGRSVEGRPIHLLKLGRGPRRLLLWSQMHGDEPSATPALLDVADFLLSRREDEGARLILERLTLLAVPMLNPDGAERYERRNAQAIDVNRDALNLATPEGQLLKAVRDRFQPELGFNLHDQNRRTTVGETGRLASIALLAVAGDAEGTVTPARLRAKRVCAAIVRALSAFVPGAIARYDEDWNPRAFGDNITAWGTPVVLLESGGLPPGRDLTDLTRLNFVALLSALHGLARDDLAGQHSTLYEGLERSRTDLYADVVLSGGRVFQPAAPAGPYRADVAFNLLGGDRVVASCDPPPAQVPSRIVEVGDARHLGAGRRIDVTGSLVVPGFVVSIRGLAAREWLTGERLDALARLGVAGIRWHVEAASRPQAESLSRALSAGSRPSIELVAAEAPLLGLEIAAPPGPPASASLASILDALAGPGWRQEGLMWQSLRVAPGEPASLLVFRPAAGAEQDPSQAFLETVFLRGRELGR